MDSANWPISKLIQKFLDKEIQLPEMQRKYVWKREKVRALIDSVYKGYPSGSILLWETDKIPETRDAAVERNTEHQLQMTLLLLDGQQRLTSLATVLTGTPVKVRVGSGTKNIPIEVYFNMDHPEKYHEDYDTEDEYEKSSDEYDDDVDEDEIVNVEHLIFQLKSKKIQNKPNWISVTKLFTKGPTSVLIEKEIQTTDPNYAKYLERLMKLYNQKENYSYPVQILDKKKSYAEVTDIFVRVNSAGMKLRAADLALALVTSKWIGAMELFSKVVSECRDAKFELDEGFLMKCLVSVSTGQNKFKIINKIPISQLKEDWEKTKKGLHFAINFLKENARIETSKILSSPFLLIPIMCLAVKNNYKFSELLERQILRWFYAAAMWGRYSRGASETTLDEDLSVIKKEENPLESMMKKILAQRGILEVKESDLVGKDTRSPFFVMSYVLARRNNAKDWGSGLIFSLQHLGRAYKNEYDHIFPRSKLDPYLMKQYNDKQKVKRLVNDIANIAFLTKRNNAIKSNKLPQEYFRTIINERGEDALTAQNITLDDALWSLDSYEDFLKDRRKRLVQGINDLMKSLEKEEPKKEKPIEEILKEGETFTIELKSSLRWDYRENKVNKELEHPILKTLTGFMNSDGGTLYVGVSNEGEILGIEKDYNTLGSDKNWDGWSKAFTNVVNNRIGKDFHKFIKPQPIQINGKTIVKINVSESTRPAWLDPDDKAEYHIRAGTTTQSLNPKEAIAYIKDKFP